METSFCPEAAACNSGRLASTAGKDAKLEVVPLPLTDHGADFKPVVVLSAGNRKPAALSTVGAEAIAYARRISWLGRRSRASASRACSTDRLAAMRLGDV